MSTVRRKPARSNFIFLLLEKLKEGSKNAFIKKVNIVQKRRF